MDILEQYTAAAPSLQNTLDIFKGEWSSRLPSALGEVEAGGVPLFEDDRIYWAAQQLGGLEGKTILELGPLEGGHTYILEKLGAVSITSVEANSRAYLKCLLIKEVLGMNRSHFIYSDCVEFLQNNQQPFDACVASGILYHMQNPAQLIALLAQTCNQLFIWTHYHDPDIIAQNSIIKGRFTAEEAAEFKGFHHLLYRQEYQTALGWSGFCGGSANYSRWMSRKDILSCCEYFGLKNIQIGFDQPDHPNGPCFAFIATKDKVEPTIALPKAILPEVQKPLVQANQQQKRQSRAKIGALQQDLQAARARIEAMESSKFWKLRKSWFQFKKTFGLPSNE